MTYTWNFNAVFAYQDAMLGGAALTLQLTLASVVLGTVGGLLLCLARGSRVRAIRLGGELFAEVFRGLPLLMVLVWLFYAFPSVLGVKLSAFDTAVIGLALNLAAFSSDIFRAGISAIPRGQWEASLALGLTELQTLRDIVFPQAARVIIPPLAGRYIETVKLTALASVIAVDELLHVGGNIISVSYRPLEVYTAIALLYLAIILPLSAGLAKLEGKQWKAQ